MKGNGIRVRDSRLLRRTGIAANLALRALLMLALLIAATLGGMMFRHFGLQETNIVLIYLLAVLLAAWLAHAYAYGILASVIATSAFNYFFTEPYLTFHVNNPNYWITFAIMTSTALVTSMLTSHVQKSALSARQKETEARTICRLTNQLTEAKDLHDIAGMTVASISECFSCKAAILCFDENGKPEETFIQQTSQNERITRKVGDAAEILRRFEGYRLGFGTGPEFYDWPLYGKDNILAILRIPAKKASAMDDSQLRLLRSLFESAALAMDRFRFAEQRMKSHEETMQERYRGSLLRAISHDLRTPLSGIIGTAEMIMGMTKGEDARYLMAESIHQDAEWLHSLVENILSLTRLHEGRLILNKQTEAAEEIIGEAVSRIAKRFPKHEIAVSVPGELLLVPMDAKLIEQVLINLLDNAASHTPPQNEISVSAVLDQDRRCAVFSVKDNGTGIAPQDLPNIFQMFYTTQARKADAGYYTGLGLAICDAIIKAHGGGIEAFNRTDKQGAEFVFTLPMEI